MNFGQGRIHALNVNVESHREVVVLCADQKRHKCAILTMWHDATKRHLKHGAVMLGCIKQGVASLVRHLLLDGSIAHICLLVCTWKMLEPETTKRTAALAKAQPSARKGGVILAPGDVRYRSSITISTPGKGLRWVHGALGALCPPISVLFTQVVTFFGLSNVKQ